MDGIYCLFQFEHRRIESTRYDAETQLFICILLIRFATFLAPAIGANYPNAIAIAAQYPVFPIIVVIHRLFNFLLFIYYYIVILIFVILVLKLHIGLCGRAPIPFREFTFVRFTAFFTISVRTNDPNTITIAT